MYVFGEEKNARALIKNSFTTKKKKCHPQVTETSDIRTS